MTDLTEQLAKERLPRGWYYILDKENTPFQAYSFGDGTFYHNIKPREILGLVPSYDEWKALNQKLNHVLKTQARQFMDNQKLQIKAEKAKDVVDITTAKKIKQFKELLKDLQSEAIDALTAIQNDCESDDFSIFNYPEVQTFYTLSEKIDEELKNDRKCNDNL